MRKLSEYENKKLLEISEKSPYSFEDIRDVFFEVNDFDALNDIIMDCSSKISPLREYFLNYKHSILGVKLSDGSIALFDAKKYIETKNVVDTFDSISKQISAEMRKDAFEGWQTHRNILNGAFKRQ